MKNREKFEKEIMDIACSGYIIAFDKEANKLTGCNKINCSECAFCSSSTTNCLDKIKEIITIYLIVKNNKNNQYIF